MYLKITHIKKSSDSKGNSANYSSQFPKNRLLFDREK